MPARTLRDFLRKHRLLLAGLALALLAIVALTWRRAVGVEVEVARPRRGELVQSIVTTGRVRPQRVRLAPIVTGHVTQLLAREGATVTAGELLLVLDDREASAAVADANAAIAQALASRSKLKTVSRAEAEEAVTQARTRKLDADRDLDRIRKLLASGYVSRENYEQAETTAALADSALRNAESQRQDLEAAGPTTRSVEAALEQARASLALAEARLAYTRIHSPVDGVVLSRSVEVGDAVAPSTIIFEIAASSSTELVVEPDERNLSLLRIDQDAQASAEAFPDDRFDARVRYIAPAVDPRRGTIEVRLVVTDPPAYLRPDMTVSVDIEVARRENALIIPLRAVRRLATDEPSVLVIDGRKALRKVVEVGIRDAESIEIRAGLDGDEHVIVSSSEPIADGEIVHAKVREP